MSIGAYRFRPSLLPTLAALALVPLFVTLGMWQLDRAEYKQALQNEYDVRIEQAPYRVTGQRVDPEAVRFRRVSAIGEYEPAREILVDNRVHQGQAGYHVVTPLRIQGSDMRVLVNRGWVPVGPDRQRRPITPAPAGVQEVVGIAAVPHADHFTLGEPDTADGWQTVWQNLDLARYASAVHFPVQAFVVLLDPQAEGGFVRDWARLDTGIATHKGYAFQWFSLAVAVVVVYILVNLEKRTGRAQGL